MEIEVTDQLVEHVARLSRLALTRDEAASLKSHFLKILQYIEDLRELDTRQVDPSLFSLEASNIYREDESWKSLPRDEGLQIAPAAEPPYFVVPQIIGDAPPVDTSVSERGEPGDRDEEA